MAKRIREIGTAMMGRVPVLKYNEIGDIMCLEHRNHLNGVVVDDAALEVMLRIEKTMQRLEVMGDDEQRWLWIELKAPAKRYRMEEADENGNYWSLVDSICEDPDGYNAYVEKHLPYSKRDGVIKRADLNRICPVYRTFEDPERVVEVVKRMKALPLWSAEEMTLRTYMHFWRLLYEAYRTRESYRPTPKSAYANMCQRDGGISP